MALSYTIPGHKVSNMLLTQTFFVSQLFAREDKHAIDQDMKNEGVYLLKNFYRGEPDRKVLRELFGIQSPRKVIPKRYHT